MLTADLVRVRRRGDALQLSPMSAKLRARAVELAEAYLSAARAAQGHSRARLAADWDVIEVAPRERKLAAGLKKLVEDRCEFDIDAPLSPARLRREVFRKAAAERRAERGGFDRARVLEETAAEHALEPGALEGALWADLREAHRLRQLDDVDAVQLVADYERAQAQAVLLRAVSVRAHVACRQAYTYRALFHRLKFLRLLHRIEAHPEGGYRIDIDGPLSLFSSVTKYGLQLALVLPSLQACDRWALSARILWGKERVPLGFELAGQGSGRPEPARLVDEVQALCERWDGAGGWRAERNDEILELAGVGLCVPDLRFVHDSGEVGYLEVLGYWSREAVWRRVELVRAGLPQRIVFAVSSRLRVSEEVLGDDLPGSLYVYKGTMLPREVARRLGTP